MLEPSGTLFSFSSLLDDFNKYYGDYNSRLNLIADMINKNISSRLGTDIYINYHSLYDVFVRYSKDVYGLVRIDDLLKPHIGDDIYRKNVLEHIKKVSGIMLEKNNPHVNKKLAYLIYHLSCLKPFSLDKKYKDVVREDNLASFYNEIIIYYLAIAILKEFDYVPQIIDKSYFLHCLKYRNLSRSSLEFIFEHIIVKN